MVVIFKKVGEGNDSDNESILSRLQEETLPPPVARVAEQVNDPPVVKPELQEQPRIATEDNDDDEASYQELEASTFWLHRLQCRVPRLYYVATELILPLLILIGMAFLFGYGLARLEMVAEIESNNQAVAQLFTQFIHTLFDRLSLYEDLGQTASQCLGQLSANYTQLEGDPLFQDNFSAWNESMFWCAYQEGEKQYKNPKVIDFVASGDLGLTFNWMNCPDSVDQLANPDPDVNFSKPVFDRLGFNPDYKHDRQYLAYIIDFDYDLNRAINTSKQYTQEQIFTDADLMANFTKNATGGTNCKVHLAGGALFWFTIMTTIGYGHTAPVTTGGRLMVYTCGFLTILGFIALNNMASNVWKNLVEDVFHRLKWKRLLRGALSVLFWLCLTFLWILVIAVAMRSYRRVRIDEDFPLSDAYWFSYITTTTVGFGDYYISHTEFQVGDMFFVPLIVLMGFNFLGIFADKLVEFYNDCFPAKSGFGKILSIQRHRSPRAASPRDHIKAAPTQGGSSAQSQALNNPRGQPQSSVPGHRHEQFQDESTSLRELDC